MKHFKIEEIRQQAYNQLYKNKTLNNKNVDCFVSGWQEAQNKCEESLLDILKKYGQYYAGDLKDNGSLYHRVYYSYSYSGYTCWPDGAIDLIQRYQDFGKKLLELASELEQIEQERVLSKVRCPNQPEE
jgi:hypothetical protein